MTSLVTDPDFPTWKEMEEASSLKEEVPIYYVANFVKNEARFL